MYTSSKKYWYMWSKHLSTKTKLFIHEVIMCLKYLLDTKYSKQNLSVRVNLI